MKAEDYIFLTIATLLFVGLDYLIGKISDENALFRVILRLTVTLLFSSGIVVYITTTLALNRH